MAQITKIQISGIQASRGSSSECAVDLLIGDRGEHRMMLNGSRWVYPQAHENASIGS